MKGLPNIRVYDPGQIGMGGRSNMVYLACTEQMDDGVMFRFLRHLEDYENLIYMQYTGLKDKNGVEIYVGDIVITELGKKQIVRWFQPLCAFVCFDANNKDLMALDETDKIIGNIYENKELLEGENYDL